MKGLRWFHGFTHPLRGVKPENQTQIHIPKTRILEEKSTGALENHQDTRRLTNRRQHIMDANMNKRPRIGKLLKAEEVAALLSISRSFAYSLMQSGQLPTVHLGRSVRVRPEDLEEFVQLNLVIR